jgi:hypothetical protein
MINNVISLQSVDHIYASTCALLESYLRAHLNVVVRFALLPELQAFVVSPREARDATSLVIADDVPASQRIYLYIHTAAHILLGHMKRPFATILEPRRGPQGALILLPKWEVEQQKQADALASVIFWGCQKSAWDATWQHLSDGFDGEASAQALQRAGHLSELLLGKRHRVLQRGLGGAVTRKALLLTLKLARATYYRTGLRPAVAHEPLVQTLRELYCVTEVVSAAA